MKVAMIHLQVELISGRKSEYRIKIRKNQYLLGMKIFTWLSPKNIKQNQEGNSLEEEWLDWAN